MDKSSENQDDVSNILIATGTHDKSSNLVNIPVQKCKFEKSLVNTPEESSMQNLVNSPEVSTEVVWNLTLDESEKITNLLKNKLNNGSNSSSSQKLKKKKSKSKSNDIKHLSEIHSLKSQEEHTKDTSKSPLMINDLLSDINLSDMNDNTNNLNETSNISVLSLNSCICSKFLRIVQEHITYNNAKNTSQTGYNKSKSKACSNDHLVNEPLSNMSSYKGPKSN
jgi:hypothetical protein